VKLRGLGDSISMRVEKHLVKENGEIYGQTQPTGQDMQASNQLKMQARPTQTLYRL
jgi:hypothetical protein